MGPTLLPVALLKLLCEPSQRGKSLLCQQRQSGAGLEMGYLTFISRAWSPLSGATGCSSAVGGRREEATGRAEGRDNGMAVIKAMVRMCAGN